MYLHLPLIALMMVQAGPQGSSKQVLGLISADLISVNGISIGSRKSRVVRILGKPRKSHHGVDREMGMGEWEKMEFPGLVVEVTKPEPIQGRPRPREGHVWRVIITSNAWRTKSNLHIGDTREEAINLLGPPASEDAQGSTKVLHYYPKGFDGFLWINIDSGVISEIGVAEDWT